MTHWYTADLHFGHEAIIQHCNRPFASADEMDRVLLRNLNETVQDQDDLWILGDFAWSRKAKKSPEWLTGLFAQLPGSRKHLIVGNHDHEATRALPWDSVSYLLDHRDGPAKQPVTLCHYPMLTWNYSRYGALQLFGHVHNNWAGSSNSINVGVDLWDFAPTTLADAIQRASTLPENQHWKNVEPD